MMEATGLGRVKTPTFNLRVEIPSRFRKFENQKCLRPPLREDDRENNSAHSWLVHVFTQPGSLTNTLLYNILFLLRGHSFTCSFMLTPGPQYVSLLAHASIVAGGTGDRSRTLSTCQAECLCFLEFCLDRRVSLTALTVDAAPDRRILSHRRAEA